MTMLIIPIVVLIILLILFILFLILSSRQERVYKTIDKDGKVKQDKPVMEEEKSKTTKGEEQKKEDVFKFMEFDKIMDNMIIQNGGSRFTMAIQCKGINYDLMSEVEQLSVEEGFITFLNTLKYPIQLYVQAQNVDLKGNVERYKANIVDLTNDYNEINEKYNKLSSAFDVDENELEETTKERDKITNVYEYANDIIKYVEKMSTNKSLLQRKFFILLSYNTSEINAADKFNKDELIDMCSTELSTRCRGIISALSSCSVSGKILNSTELAELLYSAYNRDDKSVMSVKDAVDAGMLRLYSTSLDAFTRKQEKLEEYLRAKAKLRAYQAIKYAKEHDEIQTSSGEYLAEEEEISRRATNYIKNSDFPENEKEVATKKILNDYREDKKVIQDINKAQKEAIIKQAEKDFEEIPALEKVEVPTGIQLMEKSKKMKVDPITGEVINKDDISKEQNNENVDNSQSNIEEENITEENNNIDNSNSNVENNENEDENLNVNILIDSDALNVNINNDDNNNANEEDKKINVYDEENDSIV